jgi:hypothetical protein
MMHLLSFVFLGFALLMHPSASPSPAASKSVGVVFSEAKYVPVASKEVLFVLPEIGCYGSSQEVIKYINQQDRKTTRVLVIADSPKALKYGDRFSALKVANPLFLETRVAQGKGLFLNGPVFAFVEKNKVVEEVQINCDTFKEARDKVEKFLRKPRVI